MKIEDVEKAWELKKHIDRTKKFLSQLKKEKKEHNSFTYLSIYELMDGVKADMELTDDVIEHLIVFVTEYLEKLEKEIDEL